MAESGQDYANRLEYEYLVKRHDYSETDQDSSGSGEKAEDYIDWVNTCSFMSKTGKTKTSSVTNCNNGKLELDCGEGCVRGLKVTDPEGCASKSEQVYN